MRKHRRTLVSLFCGLAAVAILVVLCHPRSEPEYKGRPLSYWVEDGYEPQKPLSYYYDPSARPSTLSFEDVAAIRRIGTNAIPYLAKWAAYKQPHWVEVLERVEGRISASQRQTAERREDKRQHRAANAQKALFLLGPDAALAFPDLARCAARIGGTNLTNPGRHCLYRLIYFYQFHQMTANTWGRTVGMSPLLANALNDTNPIVRQEAIRAYYALHVLGIKFFEDKAQTNSPYGAGSSRAWE